MPVGYRRIRGIMKKKRTFSVGKAAVLAVAFCCCLSCVKGNERKVVVKSPSGSVNIERQDDGSVSIRNQKSGATVVTRAGVSPADLGVRVYPNAQPDNSQASMMVDTPRGTLLNAFYLSSGRPEDVIDFYAKEVSKSTMTRNGHGATILGKTAQGDDITVVITDKKTATRIYLQEIKPKSEGRRN